MRSAPVDAWNMWHVGQVDTLFDRLIETYVATGEVDPDRVYLLGYSAGGDGVYQLAPRMADRFAAASMMAGHPNDASPLGLRNLPFAIFMGGEDGAYDRNKIAARWGETLDALLQKSAKPKAAKRADASDASDSGSSDSDTSGESDASRAPKRRKKRDADAGAEEDEDEDEEEAMLKKISVQHDKQKVKERF